MDLYRISCYWASLSRSCEPYLLRAPAICAIDRVELDFCILTLPLFMQLWPLCDARILAQEIPDHVQQAYRMDSITGWIQGIRFTES
jgi:hypothetical protein